MFQAEINGHTESWDPWVRRQVRDHSARLSNPSPVGTYSYTRADLARTVAAMDDFFRVYGTDSLAMGMFDLDPGTSRTPPGVPTVTTDSTPLDPRIDARIDVLTTTVAQMATITAALIARIPDPTSPRPITAALIARIPDPTSPRPRLRVRHRALPTPPTPSPPPCSSPLRHTSAIPAPPRTFVYPLPAPPATTDPTPTFT